MEHLLYEHISGYELFELKEFEKLAGASFDDYMELCQVVTHISSFPINDATEAISEMKNLQDGNLSEQLKNFIQINNVQCLHCDKSLKNALTSIGITHKSSPNITRGIKFNLKKVLKKAANKQLTLGVSHTMAKENIKYDLEREDNVVINTGYEVEHLEEQIRLLTEKTNKLINLYFPELKNKDMSYILNILNNANPEKNQSKELVEAIQEISNDELVNLKDTLILIQEKQQLLKHLEVYLADKMSHLAPNLREILGDRLSFKMIHKAGGMMNLCLYPSSTLQLLGAEKSLFRSLKMQRNTPKYGLLYNINSLKEHQGRMCRTIAAKCSLASRIDCFSDSRTSAYGKELKKNIDKKLQSFKTKTKVEKSGELLARIHKKLEKHEAKKLKVTE